MKSEIGYPVIFDATHAVQLPGGQGSAAGGRRQQLRELALSGLATGIPLLLFASSARRIPLSILGLLQYITPTLQLLLGIFAYGEDFDGKRFIGYSIIWFGLLLFAVDGFTAARRREHKGIETN